MPDDALERVAADRHHVPAATDLFEHVDGDGLRKPELHPKHLDEPARGNVVGGC